MKSSRKKIAAQAQGEPGDSVNRRILYAADNPANTTPAIMRFMAILPACMPSDAKVSPAV